VGRKKVLNDSLGKYESEFGVSWGSGVGVEGMWSGKPQKSLFRKASGLKLEAGGADTDGATPARYVPLQLPDVVCERDAMAYILARQI